MPSSYCTRFAFTSITSERGCSFTMSTFNICVTVIFIQAFSSRNLKIERIQKNAFVFYTSKLTKQAFSRWFWVIPQTPASALPCPRTCYFPCRCIIKARSSITIPIICVERDINLTSTPLNFWYFKYWKVSKSIKILMLSAKLKLKVLSSTLLNFWYFH